MRRRAAWAAPAVAPKVGEIIRDFEFTDSNGHRQLLSALRATNNLVLLIGDGGWIDSIVPQESRFASFGVKLLAFAGDNRQSTMSSDVRAALIGEGASAAYLTDRYGEIIYLWRENEGRERPAVEELLIWAEHMESRCDECFPSEWPE